jgi:F-type H+-transporting ATPase subunit b
VKRTLRQVMLIWFLAVAPVGAEAAIAVKSLPAAFGAGAAEIAETGSSAGGWRRAIGNRIRPSAEPRLEGAALAAEGGESPGASREEIFTWINFVLLVAVLAYLLRQPVREFFAGRSRQVREALEAGRKALNEAQSRLAEVEAKLTHLEEEINSFRASAAREADLERQRLEELTRRDAARLIEAARAQIEMATRAAKLELMIQSGQRIVELAEVLIRQRLDDRTRQRLVTRFVEGLAPVGAEQREN